MNRLQAIKAFTEEFAALGMEPREAEAEVKHAFANIMGCNIHTLYLRGQMPISDSEEYRMREILRRRSKGEPLAYILKERWFMGMRFKVTPDVLIPRQETEILAETAVHLIRDEVFGAALDLCTGSGCIAVSLARYTRAKITASDISEQALEVARHNARINGVTVAYIASDLFMQIEGTFDLITANPPYVSPQELKALAREVRDFEPRLALKAEQDGLEFYCRIIGEAPAYLKSNGALVLEIGEKQAPPVTKLLADNEFDRIRIIKDYSGLDRIVVARRPYAPPPKKKIETLMFDGRKYV